MEPNKQQYTIVTLHYCSVEWGSSDSTLVDKEDWQGGSSGRTLADEEDWQGGSSDSTLVDKEDWHPHSQVVLYPEAFGYGRQQKQTTTIRQDLTDCFPSLTINRQQAK